MGRKRSVFVSLDWDEDKHYKRLLMAWDANPMFDFRFADFSPSEIQSWHIPTIKSVITRAIRAATTTLVIVGESANKRHPDYREIGYTNWINFEVAKSKEAGNKLVAVKTARQNVSPAELLNAGASWAHSFSEAAILNALDS